MEELIIRDQFYHLFSIVVDTWDHGTFLPMIGDHYYQNWRGNGSEGRRLEEFLFCNVATFCSTVDRYNENEGNPGVAISSGWLSMQIVNCYANWHLLIVWRLEDLQTTNPFSGQANYTGSCTVHWLLRPSVCLHLWSPGCSSANPRCVSSIRAQYSDQHLHHISTQTLRPPPPAAITSLKFQSTIQNNNRKSRLNTVSTVCLFGG